MGRAAPRCSTGGGGSGTGGDLAAAPAGPAPASDRAAWAASWGGGGGGNRRRWPRAARGGCGPGRELRQSPHRAPAPSPAARTLLPRPCRVPAPLAWVAPAECHNPPGSGDPGVCPGPAPSAGRGGSGLARSPLSYFLPSHIFLPFPSALRARRAFPPGAGDRDWAGRPVCLCLVSVPGRFPCVGRWFCLEQEFGALQGGWSLGEIMAPVLRPCW